MANIRFLQDLGDAVVLNNNAYEKVGATVGSPTNTSGECSVVNLGGYTYNIADGQGKTIYTPGERALSNYEFGLYTGLNTYAPVYEIIYQLSNRDPNVNDDSTPQAPNNQIYKNGVCRWLNCSTGQLFYCQSNAAGAAVWVPYNTGAITPTAGGTMRIWGSGSFNIYLNGIWMGVPAGSEVDATPTSVGQGDQLYGTGGSGTGTRYGSLSFLPWTH